MAGGLKFSASTSVEPITIIKMVQAKPGTFRLQSNDQLSFTMAMESAGGARRKVDRYTGSIETRLKAPVKHRDILCRQ